MVPTARALPAAGRAGVRLLVPAPARVAIAVAAGMIITLHALVAGANTTPNAAIGYLCISLAMFACASGFWVRGRSSQGILHLRWSLIAAGAFAASIGYLSSFTQIFLHTPPARLLETICFNTSEVLYLLAVVLFFGSVSRAIVIVDSVQALLFMVLRFNLIYSRAGIDHFRINHLVVGQFVALFLFLVSLVGCLGAASRAELYFLRTLSWFFGLRLIGFFLANQVSFTWLGYEHCSLWDVPGVALWIGFAVYLLWTSPAADAVAARSARHAPSLLVRSLMPSFLALVNLMLCLFTLRIAFAPAAAAITISLVCYVIRTVLLQTAAMKDKAILQRRNEQLAGLAVLDPLTGIGNRRSLAEAYARMQARSGADCLSLLLIDVDSFKQANDRHGHLHGDRVLIALARQLELVAAGIAGSHCARLGGDEFAVLLPGISAEQASSVAEKLRRAFEAQSFDSASGTASLSIGVASLEEARNLPLEALIALADQALYRAKLLGRNRVEAHPAQELGTGTFSTASRPRTRLEGIGW
ncbi:MAG TPA: GGDEF domain-containing protein [Terracidiphilus sp.]